MKEISAREVELDDGSRIIALDEPEPPGTEPDYRYSNNVFRFDSLGNTLWQIDAGEGVRGRAPFVGLSIEEGDRLVAFRWDGGAYAIDVDTGKATYLYFAK